MESIVLGMSKGEPRIFESASVPVYFIEKALKKREEAVRRLRVIPNRLIELDNEINEVVRRIDEIKQQLDSVEPPQQSSYKHEIFKLNWKLIGLRDEKRNLQIEFPECQNIISTPINLVYVYADRRITNERVRQRGLLGGLTFSDVMDKDAEKDLEQLEQCITKVDCAIIVDNTGYSKDGKRLDHPQVALIVIDGEILYLNPNLNPEVSKWVKERVKGLNFHRAQMTERHIDASYISRYILKREEFPSIAETSRRLIDELEEIILGRPHIVCVMDDRMFFPQLKPPIDYDDFISFYNAIVGNEKQQISRYPTLERLALQGERVHRDVVRRLIARRIGEGKSVLLMNELAGLMDEKLAAFARDMNFDIVTYYNTTKGIPEFYPFNHDIGGIDVTIKVIRQSDYGFIFYGSSGEKTLDLVTVLQNGGIVYEKKEPPLKWLTDAFEDKVKGFPYEDSRFPLKRRGSQPIYPNPLIKLLIGKLEKCKINVNRRDQIPGDRNQKGRNKGCGRER